jgi:GNAT superfamily N-acetyltransferase
MTIETKELTPDLWPEVERLFGAKGACGGCWCQYWRLAKGEKWDIIKGDVAKERLRQGVATGRTMGVLAFVEGKPVGWCTFGPRPSLARLDRAPSLACDDASVAWSIPCFFVAKDFRRKGVAGALLEAALRAIEAKGGRIAEGYPSRPDAEGKYVPSFSYTGTISLFARAGFVPADDRDRGKQRVRKATGKNRGGSNPA